MARERGRSERVRSIAGGALIGLGLHILFANLDSVAAYLRHLSGPTAGEALGVLPSVALATSQVVQAYALDHQGFLLGVLRMSVSFWPLLLVIVGTMCLRDAVRDKVKPTPIKYFQK